MVHYFCHVMFIKRFKNALIKKGICILNQYHHSRQYQPLECADVHSFISAAFASDVTCSFSPAGFPLHNSGKFWDIKLCTFRKQRDQWRFSRLLVPAMTHKSLWWTHWVCRHRHTQSCGEVIWFWLSHRSNNCFSLRCWSAPTHAEPTACFLLHHTRSDASWAKSSQAIKCLIVLQSGVLGIVYTDTVHWHDM